MKDAAHVGDARSLPPSPLVPAPEDLSHSVPLKCSTPSTRAINTYFFPTRDFNERKIVQTNDAQLTNKGMYAIGMKA